jgi:hypothetical protein
LLSITTYSSFTTPLEKKFAMLIYDFDDFLAKNIATFTKVNHEKVENTKIENLQQGSHLTLTYFMG